MKKLTQKEKIEAYEHFFHQINMHAAITMNAEKVQEAIELICAWSYAHRANSYDGDDKRRQQVIDNLICKMKDFI